MAQIVKIKYVVDDKDVKDTKTEFIKTAKAAGMTEKEIEDINRDLRKMPANAKKARKGIGGIGAGLKGLAGPLAAAFAVSRIVDFGKEVTNLADIQLKAEEKVRNTIKSTGAVAGRSLDQLKKQASDLQNTSLFGDEEILTNVTASLLTFTNVTEEQFDKAQQAAINLSAQFGTDLQSSALQLGKALNDPVAGLSALSRSGVSFSADQKKVVKQLVETGQAAKAQELILAELEVQFGGAAKAAAEAGLGPFQQFKNRLFDLGEEIGKRLIPVLNAVPKIFNGLITTFRPIGEFFVGIGRSFGLLIENIEFGIKQVFNLSDSFSIGGAALSLYQGLIETVYNGLRSFFVPIIVNAAKRVQDFAATFNGLKAVLAKVADGFGSFFGAIGKFVTGDFQQARNLIGDAFESFGTNAGNAFTDAYNDTVNAFEFRKAVQESAKKEKAAFVKTGEGLGEDLGKGVKAGLKKEFDGPQVDGFDPFSIDEGDVLAGIDDVVEKAQAIINGLTTPDDILKTGTERENEIKDQITRENELREANDKQKRQEKRDRDLADLAATASIGSQISADITDAQIADIERKEAAALALAGDNADQRAKIEERFAKQKEDILRKEFNRQKAFNLALAAINTAQSILAITTVPDFTLGVASALRIAAVAAAGITQAGVIASQKFADGVIDLQGPGTATSDSIPARLSRGESVMTAKETRDFKPLFQGIRNKTISPSVLDRLNIGPNGISVQGQREGAGFNQLQPIVNVDQYGISHYNARKDENTGPAKQENATLIFG